jgi:hypothetical protein
MLKWSEAGGALPGHLRSPTTARVKRPLRLLLVSSVAFGAALPLAALADDPTEAAGEASASAEDRKSTRLNSSHRYISRMPSSA